MNAQFSNLPEKSPEADLAELLEAGCHFGHQKVKWNPKMREWIYMEKDGIHIFDLVKTASQLKKAYDAAYMLGAEGKSLVFVGTKRQARDLIQTAATSCGASYILSRWLGGLLTNWTQVRKSLKKMIKIEEGLESGAYKGYTKYERVQLEKEMNKLKRFFQGIRALSQIPDCLFVIDTVREDIAVTEAQITGVPIIGICDSNSNPDGIDVVIPANDDARKSIELIVNFVAAGYQAGKLSKAAGKKPTPKKVEAKVEEKTEEKTVEVKTEKKTEAKKEK